MKKLLLAGAAVPLDISGPALAADMPFGYVAPVQHEFHASPGRPR
jgi:hypothetical protein